MAKISTYEAPPLELHPTETGIDAYQQAARRTGAFYSQAAEDYSGLGQRVGSATRDAMQVALKSAEHHDINTGSKNFAELQSNLTQEWNNTLKNANPDDAGVAQKFREEVVEPRLQKFANDGFMTEVGQKFAEGHVAALRQHLFEKTAADMSHLAGEAAHANTRETENKLSNTVYNDPSSLDFTLKTWESSIGGIVDSSPNLGANAGAVRTTLLEHGREAIVKSAAIGSITKTGQVPDWVNDPKYSKYVNGAELRQFQKQAEAVQKSNAYYDRQIANLKKEADNNKTHADLATWMTNNLTVDPDNPNRLKVNPKAMQDALDLVRRNADAPIAATVGQTAIKFLESQEHQRAEPVVSNPAVKSALWAGLANAENPTDKLKILKAAADKDLSPRDTTLLTEAVGTMGPELLRDPLFHTAVTAASERVGVGLVGDGHERYANFMQAFWPEYQRQKNAGTLPPNALDLKDEKSLIRQSLKAYEPPQADRMMMHMLKNLGINNIDQVTKANAPAAVKAITLPPIEKRVKNNLYDTERGKMKWTGTGWVTP